MGLLSTAFELKATSKTKKYFLSNKDAFLWNAGFVSGQGAIDFLSSTINALAVNKYTGKVTAHNGVEYDSTEYSFPAKLTSLINAHYVSLNVVAIPLHKFVDDIKVISDVKNDEVMTPIEVARFFELFNAAQFEGGKVEVTSFQYQDVILTDIPQISDGKNWFSTNDEYVTNYLGYAVSLKIDKEITKYLRPVPSVDITEVARWLLN